MLIIIFIHQNVIGFVQRHRENKKWNINLYFQWKGDDDDTLWQYVIIDVDVDGDGNCVDDDSNDDDNYNNFMLLMWRADFINMELLQLRSSIAAAIVVTDDYVDKDNSNDTSNHNKWKQKHHSIVIT